MKNQNQKNQIVVCYPLFYLPANAYRVGLFTAPQNALEMFVLIFA